MTRIITTATTQGTLLGWIFYVAVVGGSANINYDKPNNKHPVTFYLLSAVSVIMAGYFVVAMAKAVKNQSKPSINQRISYGGAIDLAKHLFVGSVVGVSPPYLQRRCSLMVLLSLDTAKG